MENFTVTNIDNIEIGNEEKENTIEAQNEVVQDQGQDQTQEVLTDAVQEQSTEEVSLGEQTGGSEEAIQTQETQNEEVTFETSSIDFEEPVVETVEHDEPVADSTNLLDVLNDNKDLLTQYISANKDFSEYSEMQLVEAHLKDLHPNLSQDKIDVLLSEYDYDKDSNDAADIKKQVALELAAGDAKKHLELKKEKALQELGARTLASQSNQVLQQQQEAQARAEAAQQQFIKDTDEVFADFKGFDFTMSDTKKMNLKINNVDAVKSQQSDINNFIGKYFDLETGNATDLAGYHKAMFVAMNHEQILKRAYQQGQADAISAETHKAKNIDMNARQQHGNDVDKTPMKGGLKNFKIS